MKLPQALLNPVVDWAKDNYKSFTSNGYGRQYCYLDEFEPPEEVWQIKKLIVDAYDLHNKKQEPTLKDLCGYITDGGFVHYHKDNNLDGMIHTRFNVLVSKPFKGGVVVIDDKPIYLDEGDVWVCEAGKYLHGTTKVVGSIPRIILSYGYQI